MPGVLPGDVLRLNRASILGSRDFTLQGGRGINAATRASAEAARAVAELVAGEKEEVNGPKMRTQPPYIDERLYECRATVLGADSEPLRIKEKTKRRNRKVKTVKSKHRYTLLRISELKIKSVEELEA
jgi:large subunit ribosomal protein L21